MASTLTVICFSKDRPWQLEQLIRSVLQFWRGSYEYWILFTFSSNEFENAYKHLAKEFIQYSFIHFVQESTFCNDLSDLIKCQASKFICFHVDDMIFYRSFHVFDALNLLSDESNRLIAFFCKLNANITFSHPSSSAAPKPVFSTKANFKKYGVWMPMTAKSDWNYLWDLCGTIYSKADVLTIFERIKKEFGQNGVSSPNKFEVYGNKFVHLLFAGSGRLFAVCPKECIMSVITINRVQNDFKVPIYEKWEKTTNELLQYFVDEREMDLHKYALQTFDSVHISQLILKAKKEKMKKERNEWIVQSAKLNASDIEEWRQWLLTQSKKRIKTQKQD